MCIIYSVFIATYTTQLCSILRAHTPLTNESLELRPFYGNFIAKRLSSIKSNNCYTSIPKCRADYSPSALAAEGAGKTLSPLCCGHKSRKNNKEIRRGERTNSSPDTYIYLIELSDVTITQAGNNMHCLAIKMHERARNMRKMERGTERTIAVFQHSSSSGHNGPQYRQIGNIAINARRSRSQSLHACRICKRERESARGKATQAQTQTQTQTTMTV